MQPSVNVSANASEEEILMSMKASFGRDPSNAEILNTARHFYANGQYQQALSCCQLHVCPSAVHLTQQKRSGDPVGSSHLLGYCASMLDDRDLAIRHLKTTANTAYPADWQLLVELQLEDE